MSVSSLTDLAAKRTDTNPGDPVDDQTRRRVLVSAIPSEVLAGYTAVLGAIVGFVPADHPKDFLVLRWIWYGLWIALTPLAVWVIYRRKATAGSTRKFPVTETVVAVVAAIAWFTAMPGSPFEVILSDVAFGLTSLIVSAVAVFVLWLISPELTKGSQ